MTAPAKTAKAYGKSFRPTSVPPPAALRQAILRRLQRRTVSHGRITLPAVPGLIDSYVEMCTMLFAALGKPFENAAPRDHARKLIAQKLEEAFQQSPRANIVIEYDAPVGHALNYTISTQVWTVEQAYEDWLATRTPPLFGEHADTRIMSLAKAVTDPKASPVLDIGAGTGRNALALARLGFPVDAVEPTPKFAEMMAEDAEKEKLRVRIIKRNAFDAAEELGRDYRIILLSEVVSDFRGTGELRRLFELASERLSSEGELVFNIYLANQGYTPERAAREFGQQCYSTIFMRSELAQATANLPLSLVSDESVFEYEKGHLPQEAWPPTGWYDGWVTGRDVYDIEREKCPIEMRWLVYRKVGPGSR